MLGLSEGCPKRFTVANSPITVPADMYGKFVQVAAQGADLQYGFFLRRGAEAIPVIANNQASTFAVPSNQAGVTLSAGERTTFKLPEPEETGDYTLVLVLSGAGGAFLEMYVSQGSGSF
jgi:hypothetical protein